jgi:hypothetical protein
MVRTNNPQLELFSSLGDSDNSRNQSHKSSFLANIWHYEKIILVIIGTVIIGIVSFSLGVEKGKNIVFIPAKKPISDTVIKENSDTKDKDAMDLKKQDIPRKQDYIIQLASYKTRSFAQKEAEALKKKGFLPILFSKKGYTVLCIGNFANKEKAQSLLSELKKRYKDCYIRRL